MPADFTASSNRSKETAIQLDVLGVGADMSRVTLKQK